jgi:hypothetical protein
VGRRRRVRSVRGGGSDGAHPLVTFKPAELHGGRVMYADKCYGREEFEREVVCKQ